jgi:hypothetical protein
MADSYIRRTWGTTGNLIFEPSAMTSEKGIHLFTTMKRDS